MGFGYAWRMRHRFSWNALAILPLALATATTACPPPEDVPDAAIDAFRVRFDAPPVPPDATGGDAFDPTVDAYREPDAFVPFDAGPPDASLGMLDTGPCGSGADTGLGLCECMPLGTDCTSDPCGAGLVCVADGCGQHCQPRSGRCMGASDCPSGATCTPGPSGSFCTRATETCVDSRDCAPGFSCDAGVCTDRRIGCTLSDFDRTCPFNFFCEPRYGAPFCVRAMPRCESDGACLVGSCVDVDGDTRRECVGPGFCDATADCAADHLTCGVEPSRLSAECSTHGLCNTAAECGAGHACIDLWGDGQRECVETGGASPCARQSDCAEGQLCASPYEGGAPTCIDVPLRIAG